MYYLIEQEQQDNTPAPPSPKNLLAFVKELIDPQVKTVPRDVVIANYNDKRNIEAMMVRDFLDFAHFLKSLGLTTMSEYYSGGAGIIADVSKGKFGWLAEILFKEWKIAKQQFSTEGRKWRVI